jgi:hypothetical protein
VGSEKAEQIPFSEEIAATFDHNTEANYVDVLWFKTALPASAQKV